MTLSNNGQTAAGQSTLALYDGHPDSGGTLICQPVSYTHLRAHETVLDIVCRLLLEKKK